MNKASVEQSLNNIQKIYNAKILTTNYQVSDEEISWFGYKSGVIKGVSYPREYQLLLDNGQYCFLLEDNSFFQFYFKFGKEKLISCRMAYYPTPKIISESIDDLYDFEVGANPWLRDVYSEMALEMEYNSGVLSSNSHIRFDYDSNVKSHAKSHLQFGGINDFRITSKSLVLPFAFFEKILLDFHSNWYEIHYDFARSQPERSHGVNNCYKFNDENDLFFIST